MAAILDVGEIRSTTDDEIFLVDSGRFVSKGGFRIKSVSTLPTSPSEGDVVYYTLNDALCYYNGSKWLATGMTPCSYVRNGLILHYDFTRSDCYPGTGTTVTDLSPQGLNGTLSGSYTFTEDPNSNRYFNWINGEILTDSTYNFGTNGMTMEIVYRVRDGDPHSTYGRIIDWQDTTMSLGTYATQQFRCWVNAGGSRNSGEFIVNSSDPGFFDKWHHAVMTYDKATVKGYWDIQERFSVAKTGDLQAADRFRIADGDAYHYAGDIGLVRVYNRALTQDQIKQNFTQAKYKFGVGNLPLSSIASA